MPLALRLAAGLIAALLAACTLPPGAPAGARVAGILDGPRDRALPAEAQFVVELRQGDRLLAKQRGALRSLPQPFVLAVPPGTAAAAPQAVVVQAVMSSRGRPEWLSEPLTLPLPSAAADVGVLRLQPYRFAGGFASRLRCGERVVSIGYIGDSVRLIDGERVFDLRAPPDASGRLYELPGQPATRVLFEAQGARVTVDGVAYPPCGPAS